MELEINIKEKAEAYFEIKTADRLSELNAQNIFLH